MACIVTFARGWQSLIATRALGTKGIKVATGDTEAFATSFFSIYSKSSFIYPDPYKNEEYFIKKIIIQAQKLKKKWKEEIVIIPTHKETYIISKYKKELEKHVKLCIEDYDKIMKVHDKKVLISILKKYKVTHPKTLIPKNEKDIDFAVKTLKFPIFLKIPQGSSSLGLKKVNHSKDLKSEFYNMVNSYQLESKDYPIVQESVQGKDYCVTALYNKGKFRAMMTYVNVKSYPYKSGTGALRKTVKVPKMENIAKQLLEKIKWHGLVEIDFRMGKDNIPYLIEINPRIWGGINQSIASNINYPWLAYQIALTGDCPIVTNVTTDVVTENLLMSIMSLIDELQKNEKKKKDLMKLQHHWNKAFKTPAEFNKEMSNYVKTLKKFQKNKYDEKTFNEFFKRKCSVKEDIFGEKDPFVILGIFYPIYILCKYGKLNQYLLTGETPPKK